MAKELKKFNSLEELNSFLQDGKVVFSMATAGNIWFIEVEETNELNNSSNLSDFEELVEKCIRLGYVRRNEGINSFVVYDYKACASVVVSYDESIRKEMYTFCHLYYPGFIGTMEKNTYFNL